MSTLVLEISATKRICRGIAHLVHAHAPFVGLTRQAEAQGAAAEQHLPAGKIGAPALPINKYCRHKIITQQSDTPPARKGGGPRRVGYHACEHKLDALFATKK